MTLLEVATVILVIAILMTLLIPNLKAIQARAEKARCMANLKNLSVAANLYVQNYGQWPQIDPLLLNSDYPAYCAAWIDALSPYGISQINWICPTTQKALGDPNLKDPKNARVDYTPMPFDSDPRTPFKWSNHPWFVEHSSVHGNGNLIIFTNGTIREALDMIPKK